MDTAKEPPAARDARDRGKGNERCYTLLWRKTGEAMLFFRNGRV
jgi:hypothetical protein